MGNAMAEQTWREALDAAWKEVNAALWRYNRTRSSDPTFQMHADAYRGAVSHYDALYLEWCNQGRPR